MGAINVRTAGIDPWPGRIRKVSGRIRPFGGAARPCVDRAPNESSPNYRAGPGRRETSGVPDFTLRSPAVPRMAWTRTYRHA
ncbi:hypothetical protein F750_3481 [Streptomyces sp. PAMC 26508]|nr:hypothetical protein F750_3481 [Streptomyces sp. PAMC 26508]